MCNQKPLVSVIMPMYNSARYVAESIESVIAQTYSNWELMVIDDGSIDDSIKIVKEYSRRDDRIKLLFNDNHVGNPSAPRNYGIEKAQGEFIAFLDSDDVWLPEKLEEQLQLFKDKDTKVVFSYYKKIQADGTRRKGVVKSPDRVNYRQLLRGNVIGNLTGIYDTKRTGKHFFMHLGHEDYVYWLHILRDGGYAVNTQKVHAFYRLTDNSISRNKFKVFKWDWHIFRHIEKLDFIEASYCFCCYAVKGLLKTMR